MDIFGDEFQYFLQMRIHAMDSSRSEYLQYVEIGIVLVAMIDTGFQFGQFGEAAVVQHILYRD
jgi:hypothetical protein